MKYSDLTVDSLLSLIVGVTARLQAVITVLRYEDVISSAGRITRETVRVCSSALDPLTEALDELTALEIALDDRLLRIQRHRASTARRASLLPQQQ